MAKITIRSADGEFLASYNNLSEANTYLMHSFPGHKMQSPKGSKAQSLKVQDADGKDCAYVDLPADKSESDK